MQRLTDAAFVLHVRPYRETSALLECLTEQYGRIGLVARGVRRRGGSPAPFVPHVISWTAGGEVGTLTAIEAAGSAWLAGAVLSAGLYANELLVRLLHRDVPVEGIYHAYALLVSELATAESVPELALRQFESSLIHELGYGFSFESDADSGAPLRSDVRYRFDPRRGFVAGTGEAAYPGELLIAVARGEFERDDVRRCARDVMRSALAAQLGDRELVSRQLWRR